MTEKFSIYRHFAEKDSNKYATVEQIHEIVSGATFWEVWVRGRREKPTLKEYTKEIRDKRQMMIDRGYDKDQINREFADLKRALPCVAWSSVMVPSRNAQNAGHHSGLICVDFDHLDEAKLRRLWNEVTEDKHTFYAFLSPSSAGLKVVARVSGQEAWLPKGENCPQSELNKSLVEFHAAAVEVAWTHYEPLGVEIDEDCKDISRLCFLCHDPDAYFNPEAEAIVVPPEDKTERAKRLLAEKEKAARNDNRKNGTKAKPERRASAQVHCGEDDHDDVPAWLDSALKTLKGVEMPHGAKVNLVYAMSTIYDGADDGLDKAKTFFQEREAGEPLDEKQIEDAYRNSNGRVTAGTIWQLARDNGWEPPKRERSSPTRQENLDLESILADRSKIDTSKVEKMNNKGLMEFADLPDDPASNILGDRWLVRNAAGVLFAPSGVGKSTATAQACAAWALGEEAFGIKPARELKIVIFQSEDDDYDIREIVAGVRQVFGYTQEDCDRISANVRVFRTRRSGLAFIKEDMLPALEHYNPDLVVINPVMSFIGGDISKQELAQQAFRSELGAVMEAYNVGVLFVHHTGKTQNLDMAKLNRYQAQYLTFGSSDLVNMIRCQLFIWPTSVEGVFGFHALKRSEKIGWMAGAGEDEDGEARSKPEHTRYYAHSQTDKGTAWVPADAAQVAQVKQDEKKAKSKGRGNYTARERKLTGLALVAMLSKGKDYATKDIVKLVQNHYANEMEGEEVPSLPTIERAIKEAVALGSLDHPGRGIYKKSIPSTDN